MFHSNLASFVLAAVVVVVVVHAFLRALAVARIAIVKPDKARSLENHFLGLAQRKQLPGKVKEGALISMLEKMEKSSRPTRITVR